MERVDTRARRDAYGSKINREHSTILAETVPYLSIMLSSLLPIFPIATALPFIPPLGFLMLLAWYMLRPGLLPIWVGFPLGIFDDLFSGQPFGSAIFLWSLALIACEALESQFRWRHFLLDWGTIAAISIFYILFAALLSGATLTTHGLAALMPQLLLSILAYPVVAGVVGRLDRFRLMRIKVIG